jgi:hypothetical protein
VSVPKNAEIAVSVDHDRSAFGPIKGSDQKKDEPKAGVTPGGNATVSK